MTSSFHILFVFIDLKYKATEWIERPCGLRDFEILSSDLIFQQTEPLLSTNDSW